MNRYTLLISALLCAATLPAHAHKTAKQSLILLAKEIEEPLWRTTKPLHSPFPTQLVSQPQAPQFSISTIHRTSLRSLGQHLNLYPLRAFALEELSKAKLPIPASDLFDRMHSYIRAISIQEQGMCAQAQQTWHDDRWHATVQVGAATLVRHLWLANPHRHLLLETIDSLKTSKVKSAETIHKHNGTPSLKLSPLLAKASTTGLTDATCTLLYDIVSNQLLTVSGGLSFHIPTSTTAKPRTPDDDSTLLPLAADTFSHRITQRARELLLVPTLGYTQWGIGITGECTLHLSTNITAYTSVRALSFLTHSQTRHALSDTANPVPFLFEGISGTEIGISPDDDVNQYLRQYVYPSKREVSLRPGSLLQAHAGLLYRTGWGEVSLSYQAQWQAAESSEEAYSYLRSARSHHGLTITLMKESGEEAYIRRWHLQCRIPLARSGDGFYWGMSAGISG